MDLMQIEVAEGTRLSDVMARPDQYPEEMLAAYLDAVRVVDSQIREARKILEGKLIDRMDDENATKLVFKSIDGRNLVATKKKGAVKCEIKEFDEQLKASGFEPLTCGEYKYSPSWTKAKETRKLGGEIQLLIDEAFREGRASIVIEEKAV